MANRVDLVNFSSNFTNIGNITDQFEGWSFEFTVILSTILSISAFFTIVGNSMVLLVIIRHKGMRTRTNLFLVNLAVADLLVGLFLVPFTITTLVEHTWIFGKFMCLINGFMNSFCLIASFHTLMYISIHKYFSIVRPLSNPLKLSYILSMMAAAWLWAAIISTLNVTVLVVLHKPGTSQCGPNYPSTVRMFIVHGVIQLTVIILPAIILVFCYIRMFMEIRKHSQRLRTNSTVEEDFILCQQKKVAITLFIVLATFLIMAMPYHLYATYTTIKKDKKHFSGYLNPLAYMFLYLSSMCNPIIYAFRSPAFRQGYKEILCHTPNYVISDDSELGTRTRRLSSLIFTLRRTSTGGCRNSVHYLDNRVLALDALEPEKHKPGKQKSLFKLLRSTRQSTAQSVVHRNGDIIIMKGGKIVSVRRAGEGREGSPLLDRLKTLKQSTQIGTDLVSGLAGPGHVMFGLLCDKLDEETEDLVSKKDGDNVSEGSDEVFSQTENNKNKVTTDSNVFGFKGNIDNKAKKIDHKKPNIIVHENGKSNDSKEKKNGTANESSKFPTSGVNFSSNKVDKPHHLKSDVKDISPTDNGDVKRNGENQQINLLHLQKPSHGGVPVTENAAGLTKSGCGVGVVIHVNDNDDVLSVMPLTPHTRECLAKSDLHFSQSDPKAAKSDEETLIFRSIPSSKSSDNLSEKPSRLQRNMSVEYLGPPFHMFRSKSNVSIASWASKQQEKAKLQSKEKSSDSPEGKKSICLRSPFSSKLVTQV